MLNHQAHHIGYSPKLGNPTGRLGYLKKAIERTTGIPTRMLEIIQGTMEERRNHPLLAEFLAKKSLPSSHKIMSRLLSAPIKKKSSYQTENLFTEYRVSLRTSKGDVEIIAVMRLFRKKRLLRFPKSNGVISIRYIISKDENVHEYRQDFMISSQQFVKSKHTALDYGINVPEQWRRHLNPKLLAPPKVVYL